MRYIVCLVCSFQKEIFVPQSQDADRIPESLDDLEEVLETLTDPVKLRRTKKRIIAMAAIKQGQSREDAGKLVGNKTASGVSEVLNTYEKHGFVSLFGSNYTKRSQEERPQGRAKSVAEADTFVDDETPAQRTRSVVIGELREATSLAQSLSKELESLE